MVGEFRKKNIPFVREVFHHLKIEKTVSQWLCALEIDKDKAYNLVE